MSTFPLPGKYKIEDIKNGNADVQIDGKQFWTGYLNDKLPYHVSHILVKLADSSDTNYYNGTISEANAERLYNVIDELGAGSKKFAKIAKTYNEDPGSKDKEGDLGIMDYDTSFINEFKLGIYAYEQLYKKTNVADSKIDMNKDASAKIVDNYNDAVAEAFKEVDGNLPTVEWSVFDELKAVAKDETDENGKAVIENATLVYPRNIIYNKYLNRHAVFFISNGSTDNGNYKVINGFSDATTTGAANDKAILCADGDPTKPIIAVRASSGGEQEIHLMVVNRSPFDGENKVDPETNETRVKVLNGVSLTEYYTTFYPAQDFYPTYKSDYEVEALRGKAMTTYVNFLTNEASDTKSRAEEFASKLKSYDSDKLGKYIFLKYMQEEKIEFENSTLKEALMKWITTSVEKSQEEKDESWTKTWNEYIDKLVRQNSERTKLVPQACKIGFKKANNSLSFNEMRAANESDPNDYPEVTAAFITDLKDTLVEDLMFAGYTALEADTKADEYLAEKVQDWFKKEGGLCNDGKAHL